MRLVPNGRGDGGFLGGGEDVGDDVVGVGGVGEAGGLEVCGKVVEESAEGL